MATAQPLNFGALLMRFRIAAGLSYDALAARSGFASAELRQLEQGERLPTPAVVALLATALELTPAQQLALLRAQRGAEPPPGLPAAGASPELDPTPPPRTTGPAILTFLIADVRGYTRFTLERGDEAAARLATKFAALMRAVVEARGGRVLVLRGDEALAVFSSARQALHAALEAQDRCAAETATDPTLPLPVGIGLDAGEAVPVDDSYRGAALNLAARLCGLAGPGEVLASEGVVHVTGKVSGLAYVERGRVQLKGFAAPVRVLQVLPEERIASTEVPPARAEATAASPRQAQTTLPIGGFLGALPSGPLVAREAELRQALAAADAAAAGTGRFVLLAGEPGIGKTRLGQEVMLGVRNRGFLVAAGRCYAPEQAVAYYPFLEALAQLYHHAPEPIRAVVPQRWPDVLRLLPDQRAEIGGATTGGQEERQRLLWAVTGFVLALAEQSPVALLLDDLQWADSASLALLLHLARHTCPARVLLLGTYRDDALRRQSPLESALHSLSREQLIERITLRRLSREETAALMAASFDMGDVAPEFTTLLYQRTEGNPFFTQEVLRALLERGDVYRQEGHWEQRALDEIAVPESIRSAIAERASRLSATAQAVLQEASVLGQTCAYAELLGMSTRPESELDAALDEATAAGLVREDARGGYNFNHALTQQAFYAELPARRRHRLHRAAGEAIERQPHRERRVAELAWHFLQADDAERALPYALAAGDQAEAVFGHTEAEHYYQTAVELARELGDRPREAEALERLAKVLRVLSRYDQALAALDAALALYQQAGDPEGMGRITALIGQVHSDRGTPAEGVARLQPLLATLEARGVSARVLAGLSDALAQLLHLSGRYGEQLAEAERAAALARASQDPRLLAQVEMRRGNALRMLGRMEEATRVLEEVIRLAEETGDPEQLAYALDNVSVVYLLCGEFARTSEYGERALALAERLGDRLVIELMLLRRGINGFVMGHWEQAQADFTHAQALVEQVGMSWVSMYAALGQGLVSLARGHDDGSSYLEEAVALGERTGDLQVLRLAQSALAERDLLAGQPEAARARLEPLLDRPGQQEALVTYLMPFLSWAYLELGDQARAEEMETQCIARARAERIRLALVEALRARALRCLARTDLREAATAAEEALALARSMGYPYGEAKALYVCGQVYQRQGKSKRAREALTTAHLLLERLRERQYAPRVEHLLVALGKP
jgi:class 3 adenylate cyclase/tetratricopeptide (TPR) repeat protein